MKTKELQNILNEQPSVSGNTFLVGSLFVISSILTIFFLVLGIGLLLEGWLGFKIFLNWVSKEMRIVLNMEQRQQIARSFGTFSFLLSILFGSVIFLCKMILKRNHFIIQIEDWLFENISEIKKITQKTKK